MADQNETTGTLLRRGAALGWRRLTLPFRWLFGLSKASLVVGFLVISLTLPMVTVMSSGAYILAATVAEAITDLPSLLKRQATKAEIKLAEKEAVLAAERAAAASARAAYKAEAELNAALIRKAEIMLAKKEAALAAEHAAAVSAREATKALAILNATLICKAEAEALARAETKVLYRGEKKLLSEAVADTTARVASKIKTTLGADISSMAGQAIHYLGATVIVASVCYDAYQSCEMIKDLHELDLAFNPGQATIDTYEVCGMRVPTVAELWNMAKSAPGAALDAARGALPTFQWEAGWNDLMRHVPSADDLAQITSSGMETAKDWFPDFQWSAGWNDLMSTLGLGSTP